MFFDDFLKEDLRFFVATLWQHWSQQLSGGHDPWIPYKNTRLSSLRRRVTPTFGGGWLFMRGMHCQVVFCHIPCALFLKRHRARLIF